MWVPVYGQWRAFGHPEVNRASISLPCRTVSLKIRMLQSPKLRLAFPAPRFHSGSVSNKLQIAECLCGCIHDIDSQGSLAC